MAAQYTAFLDANVLYPAPLRDILMELAVSDMFQARWSLIVLDEMKRNILKNRGDIKDSQLNRTIEMMNSHIRDCLVYVPEELIDAIKGLPDKDDRHVVAEAQQARCHAIVTWNIKDFPKQALSGYRLEVINPDDFLTAQYDLNQGLFMECISRVRHRLKKPPKNQEEYLSALVKQGLVKTVGLLRPMKNFI